jgi:hypothetical protein
MENSAAGGVIELERRANDQRKPVERLQHTCPYTKRKLRRAEFEALLRHRRES